MKKSSRDTVFLVLNSNMRSINSNLQVSTGSNGIISYTRWGKVVTVTCGKNYEHTSAKVGTWQTIATLPTGYRPSVAMHGTIKGFSDGGWYRINTTGKFEIYLSGTATTEVLRLSSTFVAT